MRLSVPYGAVYTCVFMLIFYLLEIVLYPETFFYEATKTRTELRFAI